MIRLAGKEDYNRFVDEKCTLYTPIAVTERPDYLGCSNHVIRLFVQDNQCCAHLNECKHNA